MIFGLPIAIEELVLSAVIVFIITLFYKVLINQNTVRELKNEQKEKQQRIKELQKTNPQEANKLLNDVLKLTNKQMRMNTRPMIPTFILVIITLPWLAQLFPEAVVKLPFTLPFFGNDFGWLMWYIIISIPLNQLFRRLVGVEL